METKDFLQKIGGRKFILTLIVLGAIIIIALAAPSSLNTELLVGLLGVIATYSGSNSVLTAMALKQKPNASISSKDVNNIDAEAVSAPANVEYPTTTSTDEARISNLEARMTQNETTTAEIIQILKGALNNNQQK